MIVDVYVDTESGRNPNRTHYQRMLRDARQGKFSRVAAESPERFGRDVEEAIRAFNELKRLGIEIRFSSNPAIGSDNPTAELMIHISFVIGQFESDNLSRRVSGGLYTKMRSGGFTGKAPDGYVNVEQRSDSGMKMLQGRYHRWIDKDPEQYPIIRQAWDLLLEDRYSLAEICEILHARGYTFRSGRLFVTLDANGKKVHARNGLSRIYHNWFYAGWVVGTVGDHDEIEPGTVRGLWEPMVTTEEFERAQEILNHRSQKRTSKRTNFYLLSCLLDVCVGGDTYRLTCSTPNTSRSGGGTSYYRNTSLGIRMMCRTVDKQIPAILKHLEVHNDLIPLMQQIFEEDLTYQIESKPDEIERFQRELDSVIRRETIGFREYLNESISQETWDVIKGELKYRRQTLEAELANLERSQEIILYDLDTALSLLPHLSDLYAKLNLEEQRDLLRLVVKTIVVDEYGIIQEVELLPPFMYIHDVLTRAKKRVAASKKNTTIQFMDGGVRKTFVFRCSTQVSLGDPGRIRTYNQRIKSPMLCR
jgi:DNA invertase Pin-like site-specific DNA recombinase